MEKLEDQIKELKERRNAVILAHNYERGEVQDIADFTGDSLELARKAATVDADVIVFCGVYFMAETAAILNPGKTVLIPDPTAGCPMADMITGAQLRELKAKHPGAAAVCYVNSTAEVKAECDICVTSGNAEKVMSRFPKDRYCPTHARLTAKQIADARAAHPGATVMVHPECPREVRDATDQCLSTGGMCAYARNCAETEFIVGTELGILHRLQNENPGKTFHPAAQLTCPNMKKTTLDKVRDSLLNMETRVVVPEEIAIRAKRAIDAMLAVS